MAVQLLLGNSGVGKTKYIYQSLIQESKMKEDETFVMIVPEQFTMQTQQEIIAMEKNKGIMNIEVLSFGRLAYRIYDDLMVADKKMLNDSGKSMIIRKILEDNKDDYKIISKNIHRKGYIEEIQDLLTEIAQYQLEEKDFELVYKCIQKPILVDKMRDFEKLYSQFLQYIESDYITTETTMDLLLASIEKASFFNKTHVYIDGFYGFTPIQYKIIEQLMKKCEEVNISITISPEEEINGEGQNLYSESKKIIRKLNKITESPEIERKDDLIFNPEIPYRFLYNKSLLTISENLFRYNEIDKVKAHGIFMCETKDIKQEIGYVADSILKLIMKKGYRFRDVGILTGDIGGYEKVINHVFKEYEIPFFVDANKEIIDNPLVELIVTILDIFMYHYNYESMFRYLKNPLLGYEDKDLDIMENYCIAYGIRGRKSWEATWERPYPYLLGEENEILNEEILNRINGIKLKAMEAIVAFEEKIKGKQRIVDISLALFQFMDCLKLEEAMDVMGDSFVDQGDLARGLEYRQVYPVVGDLIDQLVEILGDTPVTMKEFSQLFTTGVQSSDVKIVPPSFDQVIVGDVERSRLSEVKALFVIGMNEGKIPSGGQKNALISDQDRLQLQEIGIELAPDNKTNLYKEQFNIYMGMLRCSEGLYISFPKRGAETNSLLPSILFYEIKNMFKDMKIVDIEKAYEERFIVNKPKPTIDRMIESIAQNNMIADNFIESLNWILSNKKWSDSIQQSLKALDDTNESKVEEIKLLHDIYGKELNNSVSRLELFAKCPFSHFARYGLHLSDRLVFEIKADSIGTLLHVAIDKFFEKLVLEEVDYADIKKELVERLVEEAVRDIVNEDKRGLFISTGRNQYIITRLTRITKRAIWTMLYQINKGEFSPTEFEYYFTGNSKEGKDLKIELDNSGIMNLRGQIDRIDSYETDDSIYLSIIDYKSSHKKLDLVSLYYGLSLQLLVYLNAAISLKKSVTNKEIIPAGAFYFHLNDPLIKAHTNRGLDEIEEEIRKELKLQGIILGQEEIIRHFDQEWVGQSDVVPAAVKKDGEFTTKSSTVTREEFESLREFVAYKTKEIGNSIINGDVNIKPFKYNKEKACDYCEYHSICRFEPGIHSNEYNELEKFSKDKLWDKIEKDIKI